MQKIIILMVISFFSYSQEALAPLDARVTNALNKVKWLGLTRVSIGSKTYNFVKDQGLDNFSQLQVGAETQGVQIGKGNYFLPVNIEFHAKSLSSIDTLDFSIFNKRIENPSDSKYVESILDLSLLNWEKTSVNEFFDAIQVNKFKFFSLRYIGSVKTKGNQFKLLFSGYIAPFQNQFAPKMSEELNLFFQDFAQGSEDVFLDPEEKSFARKYFGARNSPLSFTGSDELRGRKDTRNALLGDAYFYVGIQLFELIQLRLGAHIDSMVYNGKYNVIKFEDKKRKADINIRLGKFFKDESFLSDLNLYFYYQQDSFKSMIINNPTTRPNEPYSADLHDNDGTSFGIGIQIPFSSRKSRIDLNPRFR